MTFKDHFSDGTSAYARFRPTYPTALFDWLASCTPGKECAWDCATGSGQAAVPLAAYFSRVIATDASDGQIARATSADKVEYRVALAEESGIEAHSVDLVTVAQALHWFDHARFFEEVCRVCRRGAVFAAWTYTAADMSGDVGALVRHYNNEVIAPWWPRERSLVESRYATLSFPFEEIAAPPLAIRFDVSRDELVGYVGTWSAVRACRRETGRDPVASFAAELDELWPAGRRALALALPITVRAGRVRGPGHKD